MKRFVWIILILIGAWSALWYCCLKRHQILPQTQPDQPLTVSVQKITPQPTHVIHEYIGHVRAIQAVSVHPYISGFIDQVLVEGGAEVNAGQTLFILKQDQYLAQVEAAEAQVAQATADLEKARLYLERIQKTSSEAISQTELDNARTDFQAAEATRANMLAQLRTAQINYDYTIIDATINGVVGNITATVGEYVSPEGDPLAYILQYNPIRVSFSMPEKDFLNLGADVDFFRNGTLDLKLSNGEIIAAKGRIRFADNQIISDTSSIDLFADFENPDKKLLPGSYVIVLHDEQIPDAILVDQNLVHMSEDGDFVYTLKNSTITKTLVRVGSPVQQKVIISHGLLDGDLLITTPITPQQVGQKAEPNGES